MSDNVKSPPPPPLIFDLAVTEPASDTRIAEPFSWNPQREYAASLLGQGYHKEDAAKAAGICARQLYRWLDHPEFAAEVDRLTFLTGMAVKAERIRQIKRLIRDRMNEDEVLQSKRDVLDWIKLLREELSSLEFATIMAMSFGDDADGDLGNFDGDNE